MRMGSRGIKVCLTDGRGGIEGIPDRTQDPEMSTHNLLLDKLYLAITK